jgi:hypothetical protein
VFETLNPNSLRGVEDFSNEWVRWVWVLSEERAANPTEPIPKRAGCETKAELCYDNAGPIGISLDVRLASMVGYG